MKKSVYISESLKQAKKTNHIKEKKHEKSIILIARNAVIKCVCSTTANGMTFTQIYYLYNVDGYMVSITATIPSGYTVADIEAMFK